MNGPNQIIQTENVFTTDSDGYCKIKSPNIENENITPTSLVTAIKDTCEASDASDLIAMKVKRENQWITCS